MRTFIVFLIIQIVLKLCESKVFLTENDIPELKYLNKSVDPCEDFYEYTCGNFKNVHPRPNDQIQMDHFTLLSQEIVKTTQEILASRSSDGDSEAIKKARGAYKACVDVEYSDLMKNPELRVISEVNGFPMVTNLRRKKNYKPNPFGWYDVAKLISDYGIPMLFGTIQSIPHYEDPNKTQLYVYKEELLLPTMIRENMFLTTDETIENSLKTFASKRRLKGTSPFDTFLENMVLKLRDATGNYWTSKKEVMTNLAATKTFMVDLYNSAALPNQTEEILPLIPKTYTVTIKEIQDWTREQFEDRTQINWLKFFQIVLQKTGLTITEDTEILCADTFGTILYNIINLVEKTDPDTIKNYCLLRIFLFMAPDSDSDSRREFDKYFKGLNKQLYSREEYCTRKIIDLAGTASLSYAVAYEYQLRYFNVNKLEKAKDMIFYLWNSFTDILSNEIDWMDSHSKSHALNKVKNMITLLGYPEKSEDKEDIDEFYENLRICNWDNFGNAKNIRAFKMAYQLSQSKSRDRTVWDKSPFDANAYYTRATNRIIFPVAMLNPVFFTGEISILDYGRIGSIIGHEITHGFDSKGSTYNEDGLVKNWMSKDSKEAFNKKAECFKEQYNKYYIPQAQANVSGARTLDENLADNGGIRESYKALKQYLLDNPSSYIVENYTDDQLFFIGFGTMWCSDASDSYYQQLATYGIYPPTKYRVNGPVSNLEEFSRAFNCPIGSNMNPEDKCRLW